MLFVSLSVDVRSREVDEVNCPAGRAIALHFATPVSRGSHRNWIGGWVLCCCDSAYIRVISRPMLRFGAVDGTRKKMVVAALR